MLITTLFCVITAAVFAITATQLDLVRLAFAPGESANPFVAVINAYLPEQLSYTTTDLQRVYVDFYRLRNVFNTTWNILRHERAHTLGATHNDGTPEMDYYTTLDQNFQVLEDPFRL